VRWVAFVSIPETKHRNSPRSFRKFPRFHPREQAKIDITAHDSTGPYSILLITRFFSAYLCWFGRLYDFIYQQAAPSQDVEVDEVRILDLRTKPEKRDSVTSCFVSRKKKRPGEGAGLFRDTKRRRKCCSVSFISSTTCFSSGPKKRRIRRTCPSGHRSDDSG
jgi:hypothetical protein